MRNSGDQFPAKQQTEIERQVWDQEAGGSNPLAPTKIFARKLFCTQRLGNTNKRGSLEPLSRFECLFFRLPMQILDG
jgi:hypothetical protein